jgi:hypothetical protein
MSKSQRIRAIFEGNVIAMYSPDDERYKAAEKANRRRVSMQAQARAEQARGSHVTAGQKTIDTLGKNLSPEMLRKVMQKDIKAHHERRRKSVNSSTEYYRAGLRALFESVLDEAQDPKKLQRLQNKRLKPMTAWDATINILPKAKTRSQKKVDKRAAELRAKETDYPDPQDP